ncbi:imidazole glycerol phosphate synthase subunit HisH [Clostridium sp. E02]|uniref:imidazole glycerol phosphate synthase subunit HisH n=1 Tax=Clostridium sp. E02 TaxID=2487134 RepID=UPI000F51C6A3|nr:imidazole glycerol phosphate synthase subunit HisH [Clostridium sp. E02]
MIGIIDYDAGNLKSVEKALIALGEEPVVSRDPDVLLSADKVILPGVGSFGDAMEKLHHYQLEDVILQIVSRGTPFLGICLGLQLLFESSEECQGVKGLSLLPGKIVKFPDTLGLKVPHMGWNRLNMKPGARLFKGVDSGAYVYFVHSYYLEADVAEDVAATAEYGVTIGASVERENLFACQFHPEKSGDTGLAILKNFIQMT